MAIDALCSSSPHRDLGRKAQPSLGESARGPRESPRHLKLSVNWCVRKAIKRPAKVDRYALLYGVGGPSAGAWRRRERAGAARTNTVLAVGAFFFVHTHQQPRMWAPRLNIESRHAHDRISVSQPSELPRKVNSSGVDISPPLNPPPPSLCHWRQITPSPPSRVCSDGHARVFRAADAALCH